MPTPPHAKLHCFRCRITFTAIAIVEELEPWETPTPSSKIEEAITNCPKCGGECSILHVSPELRTLLEANRDG